MGVNLRDLFPQHPVPEGWYAGKRIAVDGHNVAFRYLTSFRGRDGDLLRSRDGRAIGHLVGYVNLVRHLRERGAEPIVVWDGQVHPRKWATVEGRIQRRLEAALDAEAALAAGDTEAHQKFLRMTTYLDAKMIEDCSRLLEALGVAVVRADHDGERYATALCHAGHADAVATEDYDALVAGAPAVLRKAGSQQPFLHHLTDLDGHGLSRAQLRHIAILCGTDWNDGVKGFGAKTALKALKEQPDMRALIAEAHAGGAGRYHRLLREAGLTVEAFDELDAFIAQMPVPAPPKATQPDPGMAVAVAEEMGVARDRVLACFC
ncbi:MAG: hypothetical protein ABR586_03505 [Thermoplasmatota archaeon]